MQNSRRTETMLLKYQVALREIQKQVERYNKFQGLNLIFQRYKIGTIPSVCMGDIASREITIDYVNEVMDRRHQREVDAISKRSMICEKPIIQESLFNMVEVDPENLTEEMCINFLKDKGYQIYKRYC